MTIDWATIFTHAWKVLLAGLAFGAGLPLLFSVGVRMWDVGAGGEHANGTVTAKNPAALAVAYVLFAIVAAAIIAGVLYVTKGSIKHYLGVTIF